MTRGIMRRLGLAPYGGDEMFLATLACAALGWMFYVCLAPLAALVVLVPWGVVVWFFRDPERQTPAVPGVLVAPADGTVMDIEELETPVFLGCRALRVGIFLSPLNVHVNRFPCDGVIAHLEYRAGMFLPAYDPRAPERNEAQEVGLVTPAGVRVLVKQISGILARRIVCEARMGEACERGRRFGMIKFGSRTELYVPLSAGPRMEVAIGQKVLGGETIMVRLAPAPTSAPESSTPQAQVAAEPGA